MRHGPVEKCRTQKLQSHLTVRKIALMLFFALGLMTNVATNPMTPRTEYYRERGFNESDARDYVELQDELLSCEKRLPLLIDKTEIPLLQKRIATIKILMAEMEAKADAARSSQSGSCFTADMRVLTINGATPIAEVKVGDKVLSLDAAGNRVAADVLKTFAAQENHYFLVNHRIKVTSLHRFSTDRGWKRACDLKIGDRLETADGVFEEIATIQRFVEDLDVFNLTISENHNFYVSSDGKRGYLVHNTGGGGGGNGGK